jgi:cell division protease FtsH
MEGEIAMILGGRIAEKLIFDDYTGGASQDIRQATKIARKMVTVYGMSDELGTVCLVGEHSSDAVILGRDFSADRNYSEDTAAKIDREIKRSIDRAYAHAEALLKANIDKLHAIAEYLLKYEVMDAEIFRAIMDEGATLEQLEAMMEARERATREANERAAQEAAARFREEEAARIAQETPVPAEEQPETPGEE